MNTDHAAVHVGGYFFEQEEQIVLWTDVFNQTVAILGGLSTIIAAMVLLVKPLRERVFGLKTMLDGQKCQLRADILNTYYRGRESRTIRQYERENTDMEYEAYKAMGGNSFIDDVYQEIKKWEVVT